MDDETVAFSDHALEAIKHRGLKKQWVIETVVHPSYREPDPNHADRTRVYRRIEEQDGRVLRVVYTRKGAVLFVITAYFDRGKRYENVL